MSVELKITSIQIEQAAGPSSGSVKPEGRAVVNLTISGQGAVIGRQEIEISVRKAYTTLDQLVVSLRTDLQQFAKELAESAEYLQV
jgi:hypothetical protein